MCHYIILASNLISLCHQYRHGSIRGQARCAGAWRSLISACFGAQPRHVVPPAPSQLSQGLLCSITNLKAPQFGFPPPHMLLGYSRKCSNTCLEHKQQRDSQRFSFLSPPVSAYRGHLASTPAASPGANQLAFRQQTTQVSLSPGMSIKTPSVSPARDSTGCFSQLFLPGADEASGRLW